jgi:hypothetical protein
MKDGQLFRVKVIKSESDLPKYGKEFIAHDKISNFTYPYCKFNKEFWLSNIDWYIQPIEIADADIEAWASLQSNPESKKDFERGLWLGLKVGAKAVINGEIKKK